MGIKVNKNFNFKDKINKNSSNLSNSSNSSNMQIYYLKMKPYFPYIISFIALLILIILLFFYFTSPEEPTPEITTESTQETAQEGATQEGATQGGSTQGKATQRKSSVPFIGNKSLDKIYTDAGGNEVLSNAQLISTIDLSTDKYSCSYLVTYRGNNIRKVECTSGCEGESDNSKFCNKYRYNDNDDIGSLGDTFLDQTYIGRRRAQGNRREGD